MTIALPELVVLDMAGTTIDDGQQVYRVLGETARAHGASPSEAEIARWHGASKHEALRELLTPRFGIPPSDAELQTVVADFQSRLSAAYADQPPRPLPGVPEALAALRDRGVKVALTTGFDRVIVESLISALGWRAPRWPTPSCAAATCRPDAPRPT